MIDFFRTLFKPERSSTTAKERLRLVLLSDHLSLAPDVVEALKADLFAVISRYVEIDATNADVTFEHRDHDVAMLANIPIRQLRPDRPMPPPPPPPASRAPELAASTVAESESGATTQVASGSTSAVAVDNSSSGASDTGSAVHKTDSAEAESSVAMQAVEPAEAGTAAQRARPAATTNGAPRRRRRRKPAPPAQVSQPQVS